jgi:hypothetical protein
MTLDALQMHRWIVPAIAAAILVASSTSAAAQSKFDGRWSVLIITDVGDCDRAYRYGVRMKGGRVIYQGETGVQVSGRVDRNGRVNVSVRRGDQQASGSGRLFGNRGVGTWRGRSPTAACSGRWEAERR